MDIGLAPLPRYVSKKEYTYQTLRDEIIEGEIRPPGQRLVIDEIAQELGVSPIPVREALQQLQGEGFVVIEPHIGARVSDVQAETIFELFELLKSAESISSRAACQKMDDNALEAIYELLKSMDQTVSDPARWARQNVELHLFICQQVNMQLVQTLFKRASSHWLRLKNLFLRDVFADRIGTAQAQHWELYEALLTRDPEHVATVIARHNESALAAYLDHLKQNGFTV